MITFDFKKDKCEDSFIVLPAIVVEKSKSLCKATKTITITFGFGHWLWAMAIIRPLALKATEA